MNEFDEGILKSVHSILRFTHNRHSRIKVFDEEIFENTPRRVMKMYNEITKGYKQDPKKVLCKTFPGSNSMVTMGDIFFSSTCEHHLVPFFGKAVVSYIPQNGRVVGISKLARLVRIYAKRFQLQERMTGQIADAIEKYLSPNCAVYTEAIHSCMIARGVEQSAVTTTTVLKGEYMERDDVKQEWNVEKAKFAGRGILK